MGGSLLCNTSPRIHHNYCGLWRLSRIFALRNSDLACMQILLYWWTFCMYWDLLNVDLFLGQMRSNKCLVSFATITILLTHPRMYFTLVCLVCGGVCLSIRLDKVV